MLNDQQLAIRRSGIGSSDIAAICGRSPFGTPLSVYQNKLGIGGKRTSNAMTSGQWLEDSVASWAANRAGWKLQRCNRTLRHAQRRWMLATPDRFIVDGRKRVGLAEIKTAQNPEWIDPEKWGRFGADGTDEVPDTYRCQAQWQMSTTGLDVVYLPAFFFLSRELRIFRIEHSADLEEALIETGREFWERHVVAASPPDLDMRSAETGTYLGRVIAERVAVALAPAEAAPWAAKLVDANRRLAAAEEDKIEAENYLKAYTGDRRGIEGPWGKFLWYTVDSAGTDWAQVARELAKEQGLDEVKLAERAAKYQKPGGRRVRFSPRGAEKETP
jgi:putative phage-type endonuclease